VAPFEQTRRLNGAHKVMKSLTIAAGVGRDLTQRMESDSCLRIWNLGGIFAAPPSQALAAINPPPSSLATTPCAWPKGGLPKRLRSLPGTRALSGGLSGLRPAVGEFARRRQGRQIFVSRGPIGRRSALQWVPAASAGQRCSAEPLKPASTPRMNFDAALGGRLIRGASMLAYPTSHKSVNMRPRGTSRDISDAVSRYISPHPLSATSARELDAQCESVRGARRHRRVGVRG
jgi:hypothetical protein